MVATYYCVKRPGICDDTCEVCPNRKTYEVGEQLEFSFMNDKPHDPISNPEHYTMGKIEVFDFISAWQLSFAEGNVIKYVTRAPYKGKRLQDLMKARWYLDQLIDEAKEDAF